MTNLAEQIAAAEAHLTQLRQKALSATCAELGHDWKHIGGCNCGCYPDACCSIPVHECTRCHIPDYGDNQEAKDHIIDCRERHPDRHIDAALIEAALWSAA